MNGKIQWLSRSLPQPIKKIAKVILSPCYHFKILVNDVKALLGIMSYPTKVIFVAGYPKSGTTWVENFISNIPGYNPRVLAGSREIIRQHNLPADAFSAIPRYGYSAIKTHITPSTQNIDVLIKNGIQKVIVMYRDPRDIIVSNYYHVLKDNPWMVEDPEYANYNAMTKQDALSHSMNLIVDDYCSWVRGWMEVAKSNSGIECFFVRYEDLRKNRKDVFKAILSFFGIFLSEEQFAGVMQASGNKSGYGKEPGMRSTKRKGASGDWKKELNRQQQEIIKEKAGQFLVELGYESGLEW